MEGQPKQKILLTGATGRFGSHVHEALLAAGHEVTATDIVPGKRDGPKVRVKNLLDREACYDLVDGQDTVVHLSALSTEMHGTAQRIFNENVSMNMNVFGAAADMGVKKVIFASSVQAVTGNRKMAEADEGQPSSLPYLPMDSDMPTFADNPYALSKVVGEQQLEYFCRQSGMQGVSVRYAGMVRHFGRLARRYRDINQIDPHYARYIRIDEAFLVVRYEQAAAFTKVLVDKDLPGYRNYLIAAPNSLMLNSYEELYKRFFPHVPLKKPLEELDSFIDLSRVIDETGWQPEPLVLEAEEEEREKQGCGSS